MIVRAAKLYLNSISGLSRQVWLLAFVTFINRSGTMVIPFLSVYMTSRLGFSLEEVGFVLLFFGLGSITGSYLGGLLTDKIGYYRILFSSLFFGGMMFLALGEMETFWEVSGMIYLVSTIGDAYRPAAMTAMARYSRPENRTRAFSLMRMAINFGWAMGPAVGGWLVATSGSYDWLFWVDGLTCMAAALAFAVFLKEKKKPAGEPAERPKPGAWKAPYLDTKFLFFMGCTTIGAIAFMQFLYTLPVFYKEEMLLTEGEIGLLLGLNGMLIFFIEMPMVYILERKFRILENAAIGVLMFGIAYVLLNLASGPSIGIAVASMVLLSVGEIFNMPFTNTYAMNRADDDNRGAYMGVFTMAYSVTHIIGPPIGTSMAANFGFDALWYLMGGLSLLSFFGILFLQKWEGKSPASEAGAAKIIQEPLPQTAE